MLFFFIQCVVWVSLPTSRNFHAQKVVSKVRFYSLSSWPSILTTTDDYLDYLRHKQSTHSTRKWISKVIEKIPLTLLSLLTSFLPESPFPQFTCLCSSVPIREGPAWPPHWKKWSENRLSPAVRFFLFLTHHLSCYKHSCLFSRGNLHERNFVCSLTITQLFIEHLNHSHYSVSNGQINECTCRLNATLPIRFPARQTFKPIFWDTRGRHLIIPILFQFMKQVDLRYPAESLHTASASPPAGLCC